MNTEISYSIIKTTSMLNYKIIFYNKKINRNRNTEIWILKIIQLCFIMYYLYDLVYIKKIFKI